MKIKLSNLQIAKIIHGNNVELTISVAGKYYNNVCEILIKNKWHYEYNGHAGGYLFIIYKHQYNYFVTEQYIIKVLGEHGYVIHNRR